LQEGLKAGRSNYNQILALDIRGPDVVGVGYSDFDPMILQPTGYQVSADGIADASVDVFLGTKA
jgi:hypothetical protein